MKTNHLVQKGNQIMPAYAIIEKDTNITIATTSSITEAFRIRQEYNNRVDILNKVTNQILLF